MQVADFLGLAGGLALFLYGMHMMSEGLELVAGSRLKALLEKLTRNRILGMLTGLFITAIIQSSNATTSMTVGFVNAGLMDLSQAIGVIMGANIGTTVTGQLIALDISAIAPAIAIIGVIMICFTKKKRSQHLGMVFAGLGVLFMGMDAMSSSMAPLRDVKWFQDLIISFKSPIIGILAGAIFTAIIQSSSASVGILQAMAMQGIIGLDNAIFFLCGQNIGCTIAAIMASFGGNKNAKRTAVVHILFNVIGTIIMVLAVKLLPLTDWIIALSPGNGSAQIANAHTIFNIATTLILLPCAPLLSKLAHLVVRGEDKRSEGPSLMHITDLSFGASSVAIGQVEAEITRMNSLARENLSIAMDAFFTGNTSEIARVHHNEETIDYLNKEITNALVKINSLELTERDAKRLGSMYHVVSDLERIGDHAENIADYAESTRERKIMFSEHSIEDLRAMISMVYQMMDDSYAHFMDKEHGPTYEDIYSLEEAIDIRTEELEAKHIERLNAGRCSSDAGMVYVEILTDLERVADHALNIAQAAHGGKR